MRVCASSARKHTDCGVTLASDGARARLLGLPLAYDTVKSFDFAFDDGRFVLELGFFHFKATCRIIRVIS